MFLFYFVILCFLMFYFAFDFGVWVEEGGENSFFSVIGCFFTLTSAAFSVRLR